ncbi:hypothetical protein FS837_004055 [Tulasnella sp. UAMH 9824]|nr:hypothetical protein FS837_004055 [Tulasnella sp. UAMH 9824]
MQSSAKKTKSEPEQTVDQLARLIPSIIDLPTELLLRVISVLPVISIRNLMVNRSFRSICEQGLYRNISLYYHQYRSMRLLETFLLRPDLALLVRHLEIYFNFDASCNFRRWPQVLRINGLDALSLAKNIRSLSLRGDVDWIWEANKDELRKVVSKMRLVRLDVPLLVDPHAGFEHEIIFSGLGLPRNNSDVDLGVDIRRLLQAQPFLEEFTLSNSVGNRSVASLRACLKGSDIPNLKSLKAAPDVAMVFFPVAPRLESLYLIMTDWNDQLLFKMETKAAAIKPTIRRFGIRAWHFDHDQWFWMNLAKVFALFPKTEKLSVAIGYEPNPGDLESLPAEFYFKTIADNLHVLPSLREIKVRYEPLNYNNPDIRKTKTETIADFKTACPLLETVVDPEYFVWMFQSDRQSPRGFAPFPVGHLLMSKMYWSPMKDLPAPKGSDF